MKATPKSNRKAILVGPCLGGPKVRKRLFDSLLIRKSDLLLGVDGGTAHCLAHGLTPDFAVGDWDSLPKKKRVLSQVRHVTVSADKDRSDLFFAVLAAIEAGATDILCIGVTGGRPDHHLATLLDLSRFSTGQYGKLASVQARGVDGEYVFLSNSIPNWTAGVGTGQMVSLFALGSEVEGVTITGFRYPLKNARLIPSSWGLSNQVGNPVGKKVGKRKCEVRLRKGNLVVIMPREESDDRWGDGRSDRRGNGCD